MGIGWLLERGRRMSAGSPPTGDGDPIDIHHHPYNVIEAPWTLSQLLIVNARGFVLDRRTSAT
ncbi:hypothetical protein AB0J68_30790, partial [Micromonospora sp. NPDC049580]|uniref:hypothetical protein n=1 Tax=Micromonospora sp. NPDC049580 TaxID=3154832 RepID=UPI003439AFD2